MMRADEQRADRLWSTLVVLRARQHCERCRRVRRLEPHHGFKRGLHGTRWDPENGWALCSDCHEFLQRSRRENAAFMRLRLGETSYHLLRQRAEAITKPTPDFVAERIKVLHAALRATGWSA